MNGADRIQIPWKERWRRFRHGTLPLLGIGTAAAITLFWRGQSYMPQAIGEVESVRIDVTAASDGDLGAAAGGAVGVVRDGRVQAGGGPAGDETPICAQLATLTEDLARIQKELTAATDRLAVSESDRSRSHLTDVTRARLKVEQRRLAVLDRRLQVEADSLQLER